MEPDDVGETVYRQVAAEAEKLKLGWQWWVLFNDFRSENQFIGNWNQSPSSITATGVEVSALLKVSGKLADLGAR